MAILTFNTIGRNTRQEAPASDSERKIVSIDEYRGIVILPARKSRGSIPAIDWGSDPLPAA